jgi:hypothetical protein
MVGTSAEEQNIAGTTGEVPAFVRPVYASEETMRLYDSVQTRMNQLEQAVIDHEQRFDTLQTPWWKRIWFWIDGWPWYDLNGAQKRRPWHRP